MHAFPWSGCIICKYFVVYLFQKDSFKTIYQRYENEVILWSEGRFKLTSVIAGQCKKLFLLNDLYLLSKQFEDNVSVL